MKNHLLLLQPFSWQCLLLYNLFWANQETVIYISTEHSKTDKKKILKCSKMLNTSSLSIFCSIKREVQQIAYFKEEFRDLLQTFFLF